MGLPQHPVEPKQTEPPLEEFRIWPNRSLPKKGYRYVLLFTGGMLSIPLIPLLGTPIGWTLLPFLLSALLLLAFFLRKNTKDGASQWEHIRIWEGLMTVERHDPGQAPRFWDANPYWVRLELKKDAPLENYLVLKGGRRDIELGAFLSPEERLTLRDDLERALGRVRRQARVHQA